MLFPLLNLQCPARTFDGDIIEPERGEQFEVGARAEF